MCNIVIKQARPSPELHEQHITWNQIRLTYTRSWYNRKLVQIQETNARSNYANVPNNTAWAQCHDMGKKRVRTRRKCRERYQNLTKVRRKVQKRIIEIDHRKKNRQNNYARHFLRGEHLRIKHQCEDMKRFNMTCNSTPMGIFTEIRNNHETKWVEIQHIDNTHQPRRD